MKTLISKGKTKDLYDLGDGFYQLFFKDDMTGRDGVFDPGENSVGLTVEGAGASGLIMTSYYFGLLNIKGIATHFVGANFLARTMDVKPVTRFGKGLEIVCRYAAMGSFVRRYGSLIESDVPLPAVVEVTLKDDERGDPLINKECLEALSILKEGEYDKLVSLTKQISGIIKDDLAEKGLELCDIKLEYGKDSQGTIILIDEISAGNMRVRKNGKIIPPLDLARIVSL